MRLTRRDIQNAIKNDGSLRRDGGRFADSKEVLENLAKGGVDTPYACRDEPLPSKPADETDPILPTHVGMNPLASPSPGPPPRPLNTGIDFNLISFGPRLKHYCFRLEACVASERLGAMRHGEGVWGRGQDQKIPPLQNCPG